MGQGRGPGANVLRAEIRAATRANPEPLSRLKVICCQVRATPQVPGSFKVGIALLSSSAVPDSTPPVSADSKLKGKKSRADFRLAITWYSGRSLMP